MNETVQKNLIAFREALGISQDDAAKASSVPVDNIRRYERGQNSPTADTLRKLGEVYGHRMDDFFMEEPPPAQLDQRPVFFLRTMPGVEVDPAVVERLENLIREANDEVRSRKRVRKR